jgi:ABC-2 type transport system ATP-binding protein
VVLTTHYLEEAEQLCARIAMLKQGRIVALDSTANLLKRVPHLFLRVRLAGAPLPGTLAPLVHAAAAGDTVLRLQDYGDIEPTLARLREAGCRIEELELMQPDLEDVFVEIMRSR